MYFIESIHKRGGVAASAIFFTYQYIIYCEWVLNNAWAWTGIVSNSIIKLHFLSDNLIGGTYLHFLREEVPSLENLAFE